MIIYDRGVLDVAAFLPRELWGALHELANPNPDPNPSPSPFTVTAHRSPLTLTLTPTLTLTLTLTRSRGRAQWRAGWPTSCSPTRIQP